MDKQTVYEHIKQQIIEEKLSPGHWFVERELCATYGLSRTPIREILWKLTLRRLSGAGAKQGIRCAETRSRTDIRGVSGAGSG